MPFIWHREDSGYLAAAAAAAAVVVYMVIGNFGLLPSPFSAPRPHAIVDGVEPVLVAPPPVEVEVTPVAAPKPDIDVLPVAPIGPVDGTSPAVSVTTEPGTSFTVAEPALIEGLVRDTGSGVEDVLVTFLSTSGVENVIPASVTCDEATNNTCFWQAKVPAAVASGYTVTAVAEDKAGNSSATEPIDVTVVNAGGTVKQVTDVVERVPNVLGKLVDSVLGILGGGQ